MSNGPRLAFTLSAYRLCDFVRLGLRQLQTLAPDEPILVSDDASPESNIIEKMAKDAGAAYKCSRIRKGHFAGDAQSLVNSIVFAEAAGADVAVKVSQRFVFRKKESIEIIRKTFEDQNICAATPGQPKYIISQNNKAANGFGSFGILSDVVCIRTGTITGSEFLAMYRERCMTQKVPWASFIECAVDDLHSKRFPGRTAKLQELTDPGTDMIYLRRYQSVEGDYKELAKTHGLNGFYPTCEWSSMERNRYICKPKVI